MNRLQLSNQLQNQCNNIEIAFAGADMILIVHFHVWPEIRPLGFKGLRACDLWSVTVLLFWQWLDLGQQQQLPLIHE